MSKFINTQFSVSGIKDFDVNNVSYEKYDLVDYQYYTGNGVNLTGIVTSIVAGTGIVGCLYRYCPPIFFDRPPFSLPTHFHYIPPSFHHSSCTGIV